MDPHSKRSCYVTLRWSRIDSMVAVPPMTPCEPLNESWTPLRSARVSRLIDRRTEVRFSCIADEPDRMVSEVPRQVQSAG